MSERRENSALMSLQELRRLEDDRVKREQEEASARAEADRRAKEESERRAREEDQQRKLAEEERLRKLDEDKQARAREEQLRLEEAERRARVEGDLKLQEQRMRMEIQARATHKSPLKAILAVAAVLVLVGGILGYRMHSQNKAEQIALQKQIEEQREAAKAAEIEYDKKMRAIQASMDAKLASASSEAQRATIRAEALAQKQEAEAAREREKRRTATAGKGGAKLGTDATKPPTGIRKPGGKIDIKDDEFLKGL